MASVLSGDRIPIVFVDAVRSSDTMQGKNDGTIGFDIVDGMNCIMESE